MDLKNKCIKTNKDRPTLSVARMYECTQGLSASMSGTIKQQNKILTAYD